LFQLSLLDPVKNLPYGTKGTVDSLDKQKLVYAYTRFQNYATRPKIARVDKTCRFISHGHGLNFQIVYNKLFRTVM
jgi:hypothetical protein